MKNVDSSVREVLSVKGQKIFDDVALQRVLGASAHIKLIAEMMRDISAGAQSQNKSADEFVQEIYRLAEFFKNTRGEASQAITNAIDLMINGLDSSKNRALVFLIDYLNKNIEAFDQINVKNLDKINQYGLSLITNMNTIMLFDYSSTVGKMVEDCEHILDILIPESRVLDGGKPYITKGHCKNHRVHFIPDAAVYYYLKNCEGVFIGAETLYPDGRVFNTVGSEMIASLCKVMAIPYYVLTTLIKIDMRALYGYQKPPVVVDLKAMLAPLFDADDTVGINFSCPELVEIPAKDISALITEEGIVPPSAIHQLATNYIKEIREN